MLEMGTSGLMSGDGKRGGASAPALAPVLDSTQVPSRGTREGRGYETREAQRAEAYLNNTLSTVSERNEVDAALSRAAAESW
jgi:hypothetical protein